MKLEVEKIWGLGGGAYLCSASVPVSSLWQEIQREFNETNGNASLPIIRSTQPNQSVEISSTAEETSQQPVRKEANTPEGSKEKIADHECGLSSVKEAARRAAAVLTVENPHNIDRHARTLFPLVFLFVNILYWLYYLCL